MTPQEIKQLQEKLVRRNNPNWYKKKKKISNNNQFEKDWKELYSGFKSAIERENT